MKKTDKLLNQFFTFILSIAALFLAACEEDQDGPINPNPDNQIAATAAEFIEVDPDLNLLYQAIQEDRFSTDFEAILNDPQATYTIFAPTDQAFQELADELDTTPEQLVASGDIENILSYHVVADQEIAAADINDGDEVESSLANAFLDFTVDDDFGVEVNDAEVIESAEVTNGIVHIVDEVLLPEALESYSAVLLYAPTEDNTSETFFSAATGETYTVGEVISTDDPLSASIDFGYYYGQTDEASLAAPANYPANIYDLQDLGWGTLNETAFRSTSLEEADFDNLQPHEDFRIVPEFTEFGTETPEAGRITGLQPGDVISFRTFDERYGLIKVTAIETGIESDAYIEIEVKVQAAM